MRRFSDILAYFMVIGLGLVFLATLSLIWLHGGIYLYEHNLVVRSLEIALGFGLVAFGVTGLRRLWKRGKEG